MAEPTPSPEQQPKRSSRVLAFVMLGVIILAIVAFLIFRPDPSGTGHRTGTSQH